MDDLKNIIKYQSEILKLTAKNKIYHDCFSSINCLLAEGVEFMTTQGVQKAIRAEIKNTYEELQLDIDVALFKD